MSTPPVVAQRMRRRENRIFLLLTIVVGVLAGLSAVLFTVAIEQTSHRLFGLTPSPLRLFAVPPLVSLVTGLLLARVFPGVRGSGVPQTEAAYQLTGGVIFGRVPLGMFITGVLSIGSGHSLGREGPSVQVGAGIASVIGRWLRLPPRRVRELVPVGAAGALSAAFNTPVAAVLFALEAIIGDLNASLLGSTVIASVAAVIVERSILGSEPLFHVPAYRLVHPAELLAYAALGVVGGLVSLAFSTSVLALRAWFLRLPPWTRIVQPAMGGLVIGAMLVYSPAIMGGGYEYVGQALNGSLLLKTMVALCLLKLAATTISYASGNAGGIFAPSLYIGAMAGGAIGMLLQRTAPFPTADPGAYALVGMGALFAGIIRTPITSVVMIFEITQDSHILVPLLVANMLSFLIARYFQPISIYHALLRQDGVHLPLPATAALTSGKTAAHVMQREVTYVSPASSVRQALQRAIERQEQVSLVGGPEQFMGTVTRRRLEDLARAGMDGHTLATIVADPFIYVHPDHPIEVVFDRLAKCDGLLPVVSRAAVHKLEGVITPSSMLSGWKIPAG